MEKKTPIFATVSQVNNYIKRVLDNNKNINDIWVKGEISNFKAHNSGHLYITLKDEYSVLKAVMFKSAARGLRFMPQDGMRVFARGRISVYEAGGMYQLYVEELIPDGIGSLHVAYEQLKNRLAAEGLFDPAHKKPIPKYPETVGVVTATTGAAVRDIINVMTRRFPHTKIIVYPALVQGAGAAQSIAEGIRYFNEKHHVDTIIAGRGGGSIEDLWAFNEEIVARAIYESKIPIISAVGHETDYTIADFVADLRAPTPSAAAELAVPSKVELKNYLNNYMRHLSQTLYYQVDRWRKLVECFELKNPIVYIDEHRITVDRYVRDLVAEQTLINMKFHKRFSAACSQLDAMSPIAVMARGYAVPMNDEKHLLSSVEEMEPGMDFNLKMADGTVRCSVKEQVEEEEIIIEGLTINEDDFTIDEKEFEVNEEEFIINENN